MTATIGKRFEMRITNTALEREMIARMFGAALLCLLAGCSRTERPPADQPDIPAISSLASAAAPVTQIEAISSGVASAAPAVPVPLEEPSEAVLRKLEFESYAEIEKMGGMPVTITATGQSLTLRPKLYEVRKKKCTPTPQAPAGWYECSLIITLSLAPDGSDPSEQSERIGVKWDPMGKWVRQ